MKYTKDIIIFFIKDSNSEWIKNDINLLFAFLSLLTILLGFVYSSFKLFLKKRNEYRAISDLEPHFSSDEVLSATRNFIQTRCQNVTPSDLDEPSDNFSLTTSEELIPFFLNKAFKNRNEKYKFYFVFAGAGMGKTTFMINLFLTYKYKIFTNPFVRNFDILLLPLGNSLAFKSLKDLSTEKRKNTILLLDAFDEDIEATRNWESRLKEIVEEVWNFREIVITCRTQFFPSQAEEPYNTGLQKFGGDKGFHLFSKIYLSPFSRKDVRKYLMKKYIFSRSFFRIDKIRKSFLIVEQSPSLIARPMLLANIDYLLDYKNMKYDNIFNIYKAFVESWLKREASRNTNAEEHLRNLHDFSFRISKDIYDNRVINDGLFLSFHDIEKRSIEYKIDLGLLDFTSRSLLNRTADGKFKFSHKSILEYFLSLRLVSDNEFLMSFDFDGMDMTIRFIQGHTELVGMEELLKIECSLTNENAKAIISTDHRLIDHENYDNSLKETYTPILLSPRGRSGVLKDLGYLRYLYLDEEDRKKFSIAPVLFLPFQEKFDNYLETLQEASSDESDFAQFILRVKLIIYKLRIQQIKNNDFISVGIAIGMPGFRYFASKIENGKNRN